MTTTSTALQVGASRQSLAEYGRRNAELFGSSDMGRRLNRSEWTVGDTASHLIFALRGFTDSAAEHYDEWLATESQIPNLRTTDRVAALNRVLIPNEPFRSPVQAGRDIAAGVDRFLSVTASLPPEQRIQTPWYGVGESLSVAEATCLLLGEQVMHGYDVARTLGRKWPITKSDALLVFGVVRTMMPKIVDSPAMGKTRAKFKLHLGPRDSFVVNVADGKAVVEPDSGQHVQVHLAADPVALALVGYGRINQWSAIARGKLFAWGTKPWLAFRFKSFFCNP
jgi:uncharacterized protein (TIGR03083 family)